MLKLIENLKNYLVGYAPSGIIIPLIRKRSYNSNLIRNFDYVGTQIFANFDGIQGLWKLIKNDCKILRFQLENGETFETSIDKLGYLRTPDFLNMCQGMFYSKK